MAQTIAIERVDHIGIRVRDLERALAFYRVLGFALVHRATGDDVAILRNEQGVELNLLFNANAGDRPQPVDGRSGEISGLYTHGAARRVDPDNDRRVGCKSHRDCPGTGSLRRKRTRLGIRTRSRSQRH